MKEQKPKTTQKAINTFSKVFSFEKVYATSGDPISLEAQAFQDHSISSVVQYTLEYPSLTAITIPNYFPNQPIKNKGNAVNAYEPQRGQWNKLTSRKISRRILSVLVQIVIIITIMFTASTCAYDFEGAVITLFGRSV